MVCGVSFVRWQVIIMWCILLTGFLDAIAITSIGWHLNAMRDEGIFGMS